VSGGTREIAVTEPSLGLRALIVIDSAARGPAFGGVRRAGYPDAEAGWADARRLARAMSLKCALAQLPAGGAKTVVLDHPQLDRDGAYARLGQVIDELGGAYVCGPDVGTGPAELAALRRTTRWVNPEGNDAGQATAAGVLAGLRGLSRVVFGDEQLGARNYGIHGLGAVGATLAAALIGAGATVRGYDRDPEARARAAALGVSLIDEDALFETPADVFMPCALGQILTAQRCASGPWRAICGAANNQLADGEDGAGILAARGIAWAPDFAVNAGAVIEGVETVLRPDHASERVAAGIAAIADRVEAILREAASAGLTPLAVATARAEAGLSSARERLKSSRAD
jgi:glutamate dehydrogenase/leucine dehydrogenase